MPGENDNVVVEEQKINEIPEYDLDFDEFPPKDWYNGLLVPEEFVYGGTVEEMESYLANNPDLDPKAITYILGRIQNELFYQKWAPQKFKKEAESVVTDPNGIIRFPNLHQEELQSTDNGCYSVALSMLLKTRGVDLHQKMIRAYRPPNNFEDHDRMMFDNTANTKQLAGFATKYMPNTAMVTVEYNYLGGTREGDVLFDAAEDIRNTVKDALINKKSPVALLVEGHYRTIVGYNMQTDELIMKDSFPYPDRPSNTEDKDYPITISELAQYSNINMSYLVDINPENPMENLDDIKGLEYVNGQYVSSNLKDYGYTPIVKDSDGNHLNTAQLINGNEFHQKNISVSVPYEFAPTAKMQRGEISYPKTQTIAESPEKQQLVETFNANLEGLFPKDQEFVFDARRDKDKLLRYFSLQHIASKIDIMTPWQVKHALDEDRIDAIVESKSLTRDFQTLLKEIDGKKLNIKEIDDAYTIIGTASDAIDKYQHNDAIQLAMSRKLLQQDILTNKDNPDELLKIGSELKVVDELLAAKGYESKDVDALISLDADYKGSKEKLDSFLEKPENIKWYAKDNDVQTVDKYAASQTLTKKYTNKNFSTKNKDVTELASIRKSMQEILRMHAESGTMFANDKEAEAFGDAMMQVDEALMDKGVASSRDIDKIINKNEEIKKPEHERTL